VVLSVAATFLLIGTISGAGAPFSLKVVEVPINLPSGVVSTTLDVNQKTFDVRVTCIFLLLIWTAVLCVFHSCYITLETLSIDRFDGRRHCGRFGPGS
jgi:hypothetical protein